MRMQWNLSSSGLAPRKSDTAKSRSDGIGGRHSQTSSRLRAKKPPRERTLESTPLPDRKAGPSAVCIEETKQHGVDLDRRFPASTAIIFSRISRA